MRTRWRLPPQRASHTRGVSAEKKKRHHITLQGVSGTRTNVSSTAHLVRNIKASRAHGSFGRDFSQACRVRCIVRPNGHESNRRNLRKRKGQRNGPSVGDTTAKAKGEHARVSGGIQSAFVSSVRSATNTTRGGDCLRLAKRHQSKTSSAVQVALAVKGRRYHNRSRRTWIERSSLAFQGCVCVWRNSTRAQRTFRNPADTDVWEFTRNRAHSI